MLLSALWSTVVGAQVVPQVTPASTVGCEKYDLLLPEDLVTKSSEKGKTVESWPRVDVNRLTECIGAMSKTLGTAMVEALLRLAADDWPKATADDLARAANAAVAAANPDAAEDQVHLALKKIYLAYTRLSAWKRQALKQGVTEDERAKLIRQYEIFAEDLHLRLKGHGLSQPFAATLVTAFSFTSAGNTTDASDADTTKSSGAGYVEFESVHFFARQQRQFDIDIAGTIGFRPTLTVVVPTGSSTPAASRVAQYQQAFVWSVSAEPNYRVADLSEVGLTATLGQTILGSSHTLVENGANSQVGVTTGASGSDSAIFWELGGKLNIFSESLDLLHLSKGLLSPMFGMAAGIRGDQRFRGLEVANGPTRQDRRLFVRLSTNAIRLTDPARADKPFVLTFALEYEKPLHGGDGAVPHGTRVLIRGDLNLFKATDSK
jgi:hypothetical protein